MLTCGDTGKVTSRILPIPSPHSPTISRGCALNSTSKSQSFGHSLGGAIALETAARHPDVPAAIIALEGTILFRSEVRENVQPFVAALRTPAWREAMHAFVEMGFTPTDDPDLRRRAHKEIKRLPQHVVASVGEQSLLWDAATAAHKCRVPVLYVDAGGALSDLEQFKALCPQLAVGKIIHVGHNQMVATPGQVNTMIDRFVAVELHHVGFEFLTREAIRRRRVPRREAYRSTRGSRRERARFLRVNSSVPTNSRPTCRPAEFISMAVDLYQSFTNPVTGDTFQGLSSDTKAYVMEWIMRPEGYVPFEHVHLAQEEIFHVKEDELRVVLDGREHIGRAGDVITVPKGARHVAYNDKRAVLTCVVEYRPGLDFYKLFQAFAGLTLDRDINRKGGVNIPKMLYFARKMNAQALARPTNIPGPLFRLLMNVFYLVGTLAGWERQYQKYTGEDIARHDEAATQF